MGKVSGQKRQGFTLIELLVVIAIIAILAAILFPVFGKAKQTAQAATCLANTKQLGAACVLYADNYGGAMVPALRAMTATRGNRAEAAAFYKTWRALIWPYIRSYNAYICPANAKQAIQYVTSLGVRCIVPSQDIPATYAVNENVGSNNCDRGKWVHTTSQYTRPSKTLLVTEINEGTWTAHHGLLMADNDNVLPNGNYRYFPRWHYNRINVAFIDGHAKSIYLRETIGNSWVECMWWDVKANPGAANKGNWDRMNSAIPPQYPPVGAL